MTVDTVDKPLLSDIFLFYFFPLSLSLYFAVLSMKELCQFARKIEAVCLSCRTNFIYLEIYILLIYMNTISELASCHLTANYRHLVLFYYNYILCCCDVCFEVVVVVVVA